MIDILVSVFSRSLLEDQQLIIMSMLTYPWRDRRGKSPDDRQSSNFVAMVNTVLSTRDVDRCT